MPQQKTQLSSQQWFTINESAEYLRVSRFEIYSYIRRGLLPYYILPGGQKEAKKQPRRRIRIEDLNNLFKGPFTS
jgi:excisionase family DNA binding protein